MAQSVSVIVNPQNTSALTPVQVSNIFLGKSNDLVAVDQAEGNALRDPFYLRLTGKDPAQLKAYWAKMMFTGKAMPLKALSSDAEVKKFVASNPNSIGYIDKSSLDGSVKLMLVP